MLRSLLFCDGRHRFHAARWAVVVVVLGVLISATGPARAQDTAGARAERDRVRSQQAATAGQVDALRAEEGQVDAALAALDDNLRARNAAYADAQRGAADAERQAQAAQAAVTAKQAEIESLRTHLSDVAVAAYVNPPSDDFLSSLRANSANDSVRKRAFLDARSGHGTDLLDELRAAEDELEQAQHDAEQAQAEARQRREAAEAELTDAEAARSQHAAFAAQVEARLDAKLGEAAALAATDKELSSQISQREAALAASLQRSRAANPAPVSGVGQPVSVPGPIALATVGGIVVAASIAGQLSALLSAAAADGIALGGTGYRDSSAQVELRRQNCGASDYAVYEMPAEQCSPPTAKPGASKHEQGLAVDFTVGGRTLSSSSAAYAWMAANAGRFGFVNLPGEPWHWSVGGG